tara:strand:- start:24 stop:509 length:486 start_codon:yes stop_codon:yes gene_type:complete
MKTFLLIAAIAASILGAFHTHSDELTDWLFTSADERKMRAWRETEPAWQERVRLAGDEEVAAIDTSDGIDAQEAYVAAHQYFLRQISGCGVISISEERDDFWEFQTFVGIAGSLGVPILIEKKSGIITSAGFPTSSITELKERPNQPVETTPGLAPNNVSV